jgi:hypothetical protein
MTHFIREYLLAVQFFTRIPITGRLADWVGYSPELLRGSAAHFPGVGVVVGAVAAAVFALVQTLLPDATFAPLVAAVFSTIATVLLTGGFHEDGLADVADGLGGSHDRERALDIMKDSRVGAFGAMALVLALLCKVAPVAACGRHGQFQVQTAGRPDFACRPADCLCLVFCGAGPCMPCAGRLEFIGWLQLCRAGAAGDAAAFQTPFARLHGRLPGQHPAGVRNRLLPRAGCQFMTPTLFTTCNALPPEGAVLAWGGPARRTICPAEN